MSSKNATSKGGTSAVNSSTVKLVKSNTSVVEGERSRYYNMACASFSERHSITQIVMNSNIYKILRCGLAHEYFVKKSCTIAMLSSRSQPGVQWDGTNYIFIVESYLNDFRSAIDRLATRLFP
jgi:hypothetical protein